MSITYRFEHGRLVSIRIVEPERGTTVQPCKCWPDNHIWFQIESLVDSTPATSAAIDYDRAYICICCGAHKIVARVK